MMLFAAVTYAYAGAVDAQEGSVQIVEVPIGSVMPAENRVMVDCAVYAVTEPDPAAKRRKRSASAAVPPDEDRRRWLVSLNFFGCIHRRLHVRNILHARDCFLFKVYLPFEAQSVRTGAISRETWETYWLDSMKGGDAEKDRLRAYLAQLANPFAPGGITSKSVAERAEAILPCVVRRENIVRFDPVKR